MQNWKKHKKEQNTLFMNTPVLIVLVKMSVFFFCIFHFCCFWNFHVFQRCLLIGFQKSKNKKIWKQQNQKNNKNKKTICKAKPNLRFLIQNKTRQQAEKQKQKNSLKENNKQNKKKKQEPDTEMRNRKEGRKIKTRERQRKRKWKRRRPQRG